MTKKREKRSPSRPKKPKLNKETLKDLDVTEKPEGDDVKGGSQGAARNTYTCVCSI